MSLMSHGKSTWSRIATVAAVSAMVLFGSAVPASAAQSAFGPKNCYNYYVMMWGTSSGNTEHFHASSAGTTTFFTWTTSGYHLSSAYKKTSGQLVTATGSLQSAGNGCDY